GKFALGKFGIVFTENCAVEPRGRVTQGDLGMWDDGQIEGHKRLVRFLKQEGALAGTQITHSGRKGSTPRSFDKPGHLGPEGARAVREGWPAHKPMFIRVSTVDGAGGWEVEDTVAFAKELKALGIDVIDCSSGGLTGLSTALPIKRSLGFQVPFSAAVKRQAG